MTLKNFAYKNYISVNSIELHRFTDSVFVHMWRLPKALILQLQEN